MSCRKSLGVSLVVLLCIHSFVHGQETMVNLNGKVIDRETGLPLSFANIRVHNKNTGTVSNEEGNFLFKIPADLLQDSLEVSFVGYQTSWFLAKLASDRFKIVALTPAVRTLGEITIRAKGALDIIKEFIARIPENYDTTGKKMQAFYREAINLGNDSINYSEAVLDIYKGSYTKSSDKDQMNLLKGRRAKIKWRGDPLYGWMSNLSNGAGNSLRSDVAKYHNSPFLPTNPVEFKYYNYVLENILDLGNKSVYVISFTPSSKTPRSHNALQGRFYINTSSFAIERLEWGLGTHGLRFLNNHRGFGYTIMSVAYQVSVHFTNASEIVSWYELNGKWYLKDVQRFISASVTSRKRKMINAKWNAKSLLVITAIQSGKATPWDEKDNIMSKTNSIPTLMNGKDHEMKFWENYNIVRPAYADTIGTRPEAKDSLISRDRASNRQNGFTKADTLHGKLTSLRTCYDVLFYHLDVRVDPDKKFIEGSSIIRFRVVTSFSKMQIDLYENMKIEKILWKDTKLQYVREFGAVYIDFPTMLAQNEIHEIKVFYSGHPQVPNPNISMNGGFLWSKDKNGKPWVQVVCQGSGSSLWWPCKDHLSDKPDSARITVSVPSGLLDISNGRLRSKTELPGGLTRFDWYVTYPINNYNITLNIGDYLHIRDGYNGLTDSITLDYYYLKQSEEKAKLVFKKVKPMLALFEKYFGPYPFPRDGFSLMESLYPMEHQSAVSIGKLNDKTDSAEMAATVQLMYHESSHEWWGNSVSIKDYADFWIHEAFATYAESLKIETEYGYDASAEQMNEQNISNKEPMIGAPDVNHIFYAIGDIYNKGCLMLNTLRHVVNNDTLWFGLLTGIQKKFKYGSVTSSDIEHYISQRTKTDYRYFFDQYLRQSSPPKLIVHITQQGTSLRLNYKWETAAKEFRMPIKVTLSKDRFGFIYPTGTFKTEIIKNMKLEEFDVDERDFYVIVESE